MASITKSVEVNVPVRTAYNQWTQFESFPHFMEGVEQVTQLDDTHLHWKASVAGKESEWDAVVTEQIPDERIAWNSTDGKNNAGVVTFHRIGEGTTKVTVQMDWEPSGIVESIGSAVGADDRRVQGDLDKFKEFIESQGQETGAWRGAVDQTSTF
jgi:uncharacterized membrane protein